MQLLHLPGSAENRGLMSLSAQAMTQLNQHIYLYAVVLLGTVGAQHPTETRWACALGAALASLRWPGR